MSDSGIDTQSKINLQQKLDEISEKNSNATLNYELIPDDLAVVLIALDRTLGSNSFSRVFSRSECSSLAPSYSSTFIDKLWHSSIILDRPEAAKPDAYFLKDEQVWHYNNLIVYTITPDENCSNPEDLMMILNGRQFKDGALLRTLWLEYAMSDCIAYLISQITMHNMRIDEDGISEIRPILHTALQSYAVAEVWSVIWKTVKDAAALSQREYYNLNKASATIPGKIMRHFEQVTKGKATLRIWDRPLDQPAGTIGQVFYELFGVDENTPGSELGNVFQAHSPPEEGMEFKFDLPITDSLRRSIDGILNRTKKQNISAEMMRNFAEFIAHDFGFEESINMLEELYPVKKRSKTATSKEIEPGHK